MTRESDPVGEMVAVLIAGVAAGYAAFMFAIIFAGFAQIIGIGHFTSTATVLPSFALGILVAIPLAWKLSNALLPS